MILGFISEFFAGLLSDIGQKMPLSLRCKALELGAELGLQGMASSVKPVVLLLNYVRMPKPQAQADQWMKMQD